AGALFDKWLIALILLSVTVVMADSVASISARWGELFDVLEWGFTALFTLEYLARIACVRHPWRYMRSFWG
ncbi:MAG: ion transporter, partial [Ottowia sp.]|nr:ion transporter [Ottowia sp.]